MNNGRTFPRKLTSAESILLFSVLPEEKSGYKIYRDKIKSLLVVSSGRFGGGNFILSNENSKPDLSIPSSPVFAVGTNIYKVQLTLRFMKKLRMKLNMIFRYAIRTLFRIH